MTEGEHGPYNCAGARAEDQIEFLVEAHAYEPFDFAEDTKGVKTLGTPTVQS